MSAQERASPADIWGVGIAFALGGGYFVLVGMGVLPMPDGDTKTPGAIIVCAGLAFLFAGLTCMLRAKAGMNDQESEVPEGAPRWTKLTYRMLAIGVVGALAIIGTWIAIGSGPRSFSVSAPFGEMRTAGEAIGRTVFGLGAVIVWIYAIGLTVGTVRKFFGPSPVIPGHTERARTRNPEPHAERSAGFRTAAPVRGFRNDEN